MLIYYLNGNFINASDCKISILDRGFKFGDGIFETISFCNDKIFLLDDHLRRLSHALSVLKINYDCSILSDILKKLITKNNIKNGILRITITRGSESFGYMPKIDSKPNIAIEIRRSSNIDFTPKKLVISSYIKPAAHHYPTQLKTCQGLNSTLAIIEAREKGYDEALLLSENKNISEASSANIFFINNNLLVTPSLNNNLLAGVIRNYIINNTKLECQESNISISDTIEFDYAFLTNSNYKLMPIQTISNQENKIIFNSKANNSFEEITKKLGVSFI